MQRPTAWLRARKACWVYHWSPVRGRPGFVVGFKEDGIESERRKKRASEFFLFLPPPPGDPERPRDLEKKRKKKNRERHISMCSFFFFSNQNSPTAGFEDRAGSIPLSYACALRSLNCLFATTCDEVALGKGTPKTSTARARASAKSRPSEAFPRQTARNSAGLFLSREMAE